MTKEKKRLNPSQTLTERESVPLSKGLCNNYQEGGRGLKNERGGGGGIT